VTKLLNDQINVELTAQYSYLRLAHLFQQPFLYYPKFADFFREKSIEEMTHAEDFMTYQTQRGVQSTATPSFSAENTVDSCINIDSLYQGFVCARDLEIFVTNKLTTLVSKVNKVKCIMDSETDMDDNVKYNDHLRTGQAVLVEYKEGENTKVISLKEASASTTATNCDDVTLEYIELAEHISHEYLGHQILDTKVLANAVATLARCAEGERESDGRYQSFDNTCVFAVERLLKLE